MACTCTCIYLSMVCQVFLELPAMSLLRPGALSLSLSLRSVTFPAISETPGFLLLFFLTPGE